MTTRFSTAALMLVVAIGCGKSDLLVGAGDAGDAGGDTDTDTGPSYDCGDLPPGPFEPVLIENAIASLDVEFDELGNLVGSDDFSIYKTPYSGEPVAFVETGDFRGGLEYLPDGDLVYADHDDGAVYRVDSEGEIHDVVSGIVQPRGIAVDPEGLIYVAEQLNGRIFRADPENSGVELLAETSHMPSALSFGAEYDVLYIVTFSGTAEDPFVHAMAIGDDDTPWEVEVWSDPVGTGHHVGIGVDACDNVYVADYDGSTGRIYRISPDGAPEDEPLVELADEYLNGIQWGAGAGGWRADSLYLSSGSSHRVWRVDVGVPGKPRVFP